jgi:ketosteroid isomerase-like protein
LSHPNENLIRELFRLFTSGDRQGAVALFAEDAVFRYPGPGPLHGDHRGRSGILDFWAQQDRLSGGVRPEMLDLVVGDRNAFLLVRIGREDGGPSWLRVVVYEISEGKIVGARVFEDDPSAAQAFFSRRGEPSR